MEEKIVKRVVKGFFLIMMTLILIFQSLGLLLKINDNLKTYSVYYAQHMPHGEGQMPEVIMLIDNLDWVYKPAIEGIRYDIDGTRVIIDKRNNERAFGNLYLEETVYPYRNEQNISYTFNYKLELLYVMDSVEYEEIDISTVDQEKIKAEIQAFLKPVIDAQSEPEFNLQWLFNLIYQNKFK